MMPSNAREIMLFETELTGNGHKIVKFVKEF